MALHIRKKIRDAVVVALTGLPTTQDRVFPWRADPLTVDQLPAIKVLTPDSTRGGVAITIEAIVALEGEVEELIDWLDEIAVEIEGAINADVTFGGVAIDATQNAAAISIDNEGATPVAVLSMQYLVAADAAGTMGIVKVDGAVLGRLRGFNLTREHDPADVSHAATAWREYSPKTLGAWSATIEMRRDPADAPQNALVFKSVHAFEFFPSGAAAASHAGSGIVAGIDDDAGGEGETIRTLTIVGSGILS